MTSLTQRLPTEVAPAPVVSAADAFSQSSTRVAKTTDATPAAAAAPQTTVAAPAAPLVETGQAKPPPTRDANGSTAAGSPADSEKAPPAAAAAALDAAAVAAEPPKRAPLVAAPLLDPPRTYEKDAKTIRALISLDEGPGLLVVAPADATVDDICKLCQPRVEKRFGKDASLALKLGVYGALPSTTKSLPDSARFEGIVRRTRASQVSLGGSGGEKRTRKAARTARKRFRGAADSSSDDDYNAGGCLPVAAVAPPSNAGELRARARVLFAELSMLTDGAARRPCLPCRRRRGDAAAGTPPPRRRRRVLVRSSRRRTSSTYRAGRDKTYRREVRTLLAARGWRVNVHGNQELGAVPPDGWPHVATILERSKNSSKASIRTITGAIDRDRAQNELEARSTRGRTPVRRRTPANTRGRIPPRRNTSRRRRRSSRTPRRTWRCPRRRPRARSGSRPRRP